MRNCQELCLESLVQNRYYNLIILPGRWHLVHGDSRLQFHQVKTLASKSTPSFLGHTSIQTSKLRLASPKLTTPNPLHGLEHPKAALHDCITPHRLRLSLTALTLPQTIALPIAARKPRLRRAARSATARLTFYCKQRCQRRLLVAVMVICGVRVYAMCRL